MEKLLSVKEKADELGVSRQRVHQMIQEGKIKAKRYGFFWLIKG